MRRFALKPTFVLTSFFLLVAGMAAILAGPVSLSAGDVLRVLLPFVDDSTVSSQAKLIVEDIRLPRMLLSLVVGAMLGICGAAMQGVFRNPLADPSLIGITAGAVLGASLVIVLLEAIQVELLFWQVSLVSVGAFSGGLVVAALVYGMAYGRVGGASSRSGSVATMLLAGIAITAMVGSISSLLEYSADSQALRQISLWRMGGLDNADFNSIVFIALVFAVVGTGLFRHADGLNALLLGESEARYLGIDTDAVTKRLIVMVAIGMGVAVAVSGAIAFVGLMVPHLFRLMVGPDHRVLLPLSALGGALLLCLSDSLARVLLAPNEIPVGIITSLAGAPFFIYILRTQTVFKW